MRRYLVERRIPEGVQIGRVTAFVVWWSGHCWTADRPKAQEYATFMSAGNVALAVKNASVVMEVGP